MSGGQAGSHSLAFRVMRLCRPSFQIDHPLRCDPFDLMLGEDFFDDDLQSPTSLSSLLAEDDQSKEQESYWRRFELESPLDAMGLSGLLVLPQAFGAIYLGETFCSYVSVGNHSNYEVRDVVIKAEMQTERQRLVLSDTSKSPIESIRAGGRYDFIIEHDIKELGAHTLVCMAVYTDADGERKNLPQFFKFVVANPLSVRTKVRSVKESTFLEACIENHTKSHLYMDQVQFEPVQPWTATALTADGVKSEVDSQIRDIFKAPDLIRANGGIRNYLYQLKQPSAESRLVEVEGSNSLGKLQLTWRTNLGEPGRLQTQQILGNSIPHKEVDLQIVQLPPHIILERPFLVQARLRNHTEKRTGPLEISLSQDDDSEGQYSEEQDSEEKEDFVNVTPEDFAQNCPYTWYPSVHRPSAPPLLNGDGNESPTTSTTMDTEPPQWIPDSTTSICMQCWAPFKPLICCRHHCRFCGGIFCGRCTSRRCLLPVKFRVREPQRVCDGCNSKLEPLQRFLRNRVSNAVQIATHDVTDWTCMRGWLNMPIGMSMEEEIYKSTNVLRSYCEIGRLKPERSIPQSVLKGAVGLAILTVAKAGMILTYKAGTGLVIARRENGSWSAPSAIVSFGLGWGPQMGGELTDFVIVLRNYKAVKAFSGRIHLSFGAGLSAAAGFLGRAAEADLRAGNAGFAACYTYSSSKGAFIGLSLEGNIVTTRTDTNSRFYGDPDLKATDILLGSVESPRAAAALYSALDDLFSNMS